MIVTQEIKATTAAVAIVAIVAIILKEYHFNKTHIFINNLISILNNII
jgi:hypothetical protein